MAPRKGNVKKLNENNSKGSGDSDPPNLWPKILPSPDLPCGGNAPVRRLQLRNKMQILLVSTVTDTIYSPWAHTFPLLSDTFRSTTPLSKTLSEDLVLRLAENPLNCSGPGSVSFMDGNSVGRRCNFSIAVGSGATSDPNNAQGMAHFLEHIVHHGSAKYWEDDLLLNFLSKNDGHYNAFTDREVTCYYSEFKFSLKALRLGLDMYADLLINPKVDIDFIQKEVHSIENELHLRRCHNAFRINQLVHTLGIPGEHPMKKFMCGSLATLFPSSRNAQELRNEILKFHQAHYRPDNMALVVQAPVPLNVLQEFVLDTFGLISPSLDIKSQANSTKLTNPFSIKAFNKLITIKPGSRDNHTCEVIWAFPPEAWKNYKEKPMQYIAEVLANNHPGGLRQFLQDREWVLEMIAGTNSSGRNSFCNEYETLFSITIFLTQKGRDELSDVLEAVFAYIRFARKNGVNESIFEKLKATSEAMFRSFPLGNSPNDSNDLAKRLLSNYEMKHLVTGNTLYFNYNPGTIKKYFDELKPEKACFVLVTADTGKLEYMTEEWYGARYIVQNLEPQMLKKLNTGNRFTRHFCDKRPTNPVNLETICEIDKTLSLEAPQLIQTSEQISMEYHPSRPIKTPQSMYVIHIISNFNPNLVRSKAPAFHIYSKMWQLKTETKSSYIHHLELGTSVSIAFRQEVPCLSVHVIGFNKIAEEVVKTLMDDFFDPNWTEEEEEKLFEISKEHLLHSYYASVTTTYEYARDLFKRIKGIDHLTSVECYDELKRMTVQDIRNLIQQYKSKLCLHGSANGAVTEAQVREICQHMENKHFSRMNSIEIALMQHRDNSSEIKILELGERCLRIKSVLPNEKPFVLLNYYQMDTPNKESTKITMALARLIQDTVGYELRSKEQLGYVVNAFAVSDVRNGICILVMANSDRHSICHIDNRIENCIKTFLEVKLTRENLLPLIRAGKIMRDPAYVQEIARKYLLDKGTTKNERGYRKLSIQVCHENLHVKCSGECCHQTKWLKPLFHIGKERAEICVAGPRNPPLRNAEVYFIESTEAFHKYPGK